MPPSPEGPEPPTGGVDPEGGGDPGFLDPATIALLTDQYELAMVASYLRRGMREAAVFEHFVRELPPRRAWFMSAGLGPTLELIATLRFGEAELAYLRSLGMDQGLLDFLGTFRFTGDVDAAPEGTVLFAGEPLLRVTAPLPEAQLLETLVLNQMNFQSMVATKAARVVLAAGGGRPHAAGAVVDFSARRDHGGEAAMKVARSASIAGCAGTSNLAAAMRYDLAPVGTMAHSYVLAFDSEREAFESFMQDNPESTVMLVDTFESEAGVRNAIEASASTGIPLAGIRLDSGDLDRLSRVARSMLDEAGHREATIVASGDLDEERIGRLVAAGAPIDVWGVGTELGTSRDSPVLGGVYKLVAISRAGRWRGVAKRSPEKETHPGPKQVFRRYAAGRMAGDVIAPPEADVDGEQLLVPVMRSGEIVHRESLEEIRVRAMGQLELLPEALREAQRPGYPVELA